MDRRPGHGVDDLHRQRPVALGEDREIERCGLAGVDGSGSRGEVVTGWSRDEADRRGRLSVVTDIHVLEAVEAVLVRLGDATAVAVHRGTGEREVRVLVAEVSFDRPGVPRGDRDVEDDGHLGAARGDVDRPGIADRPRGEPGGGTACATYPAGELSWPSGIERLTTKRPCSSVTAGGMTRSGTPNTTVAFAAGRLLPRYRTWPPVSVAVHFLTSSYSTSAGVSAATNAPLS